MWIDNTTGAIATTHSEIRDMRPLMSLPANLTEDAIEFANFSLVSIPDLVYDPLTQKAVLADPEFVDGKWIREWSVAPIYDTPEELAAAVADAKKAKNEEINAARLASNMHSFTYLGKQIACDPLSRSDIDATNGYISLFGAFHPNWPGAWKAIDNSIVMIPTIDEWKSFYKAMVDQGQINFARAQALKARLAVATTLQEVAEISW